MTAPPFRLQHGTGSAHEEGYSSESNSWEHEGETVRHEWCEYGRDCDGRYERAGERECAVGELAAVNAGDESEFRSPNWQPVGQVRIRDYEAEAAGY